MNPLQAYADSYRLMGRIGDGSVLCASVAVDIERNMMPHAEPMTAAQFDTLRTLRLWHYRSVLRYTAKINRIERQLAAMPGKPQILFMLITAKKKHSLHLGFVQHLNDFFSVHDVVTVDYENERARRTEVPKV